MTVVSGDKEVLAHKGSLHYLVNKEVFTKKGSLLCRGLLAFPCQEMLEGRRGIFQLLEVEGLATDGEVDVVLLSVKTTLTMNF